MGISAPGTVTGRLVVSRLGKLGKLNVPRVIPLSIGLISGLWLGLGLVTCIVLHSLLLVVYRLWLSPICHFPGPKLAAATGWYQAYYQVVHYGQWCFKVKELHERYGPIVRINPWELSINDAKFHPHVNSPTPSRRIEAYLGAGFEGTGLTEGSVGFTISHELHHERRGPLEPFFTRRTVEKSLEHMIAKYALQLTQRLKQKRGTGAILCPDHMIVSFSTDIAAKHVFGETLGLFEDENFSPHWAETISCWIRHFPIAMTFPWAISLFLSLPNFLQAFFKPKGMAWSLPTILVDKLLSETASSSVSINVNNNPKHPSYWSPPLCPPKRSSSPTHFSTPTPTAIGRALLLNPFVSPQDKSRERMISQLSAIVLAAAGPRLLASGMYYILATPRIEDRLRTELAGLMKPHIGRGTMPNSRELEKLPYMKACVKECLRLFMGIVRQLPRRHVDDEIVYPGSGPGMERGEVHMGRKADGGKAGNTRGTREWVIPKNTPVGFCTFLQHYDEDVFPEPWSFIPERWLGEYDFCMDRNMIPFGRGARSCLGRNLVHIEMYYLLVAFFGPEAPKMRIHDTDESDVRFATDCFAAFPKLDTKGLRVAFE